MLARRSLPTAGQSQWMQAMSCPWPGLLQTARWSRSTSSPLITVSSAEPSYVRGSSGKVWPNGSRFRLTGRFWNMHDLLERAIEQAAHRGAQYADARITENQ